MNVLHVTPTYYPATYWGGSVFATYHLNNNLARIPELRLKVLTTNAAGPKPSENLSQLSINTTQYPGYDVIFTKRTAYSSTSLELITKLKELTPWADIIHLTGVYSFPTIPTILMAKIFRKPIIWSLMGAILSTHVWEKAKKRHLKKMWEYTCKFIIPNSKTVLHTTSSKERDIAEIIFPCIPIYVVENGVPVPKSLPPKEWAPKGKLRILFLGRISPIKGIENLINAVKLLDDPTIELTICGTGDEKYLKKLKAKAENAISNITFTGHVDGDRKTKAFLNADLCVVPSFSENFGIVVAEALAHGIPVIASKKTPWDTLEEHGCGLWVDNSPEHLAKAIKNIRNMDLKKMGKAGREWMKKEYDWKTIALKMYKLYQRIKAEKARR